MDESKHIFKAMIVALNSKYIHTNLAAYQIQAYARSFQENIQVKEYTINHQLEEIMADIYKEKPDFIVFSCYIWNIRQINELARELKKVLPNLTIWYGGPEVSFEGEKYLTDYDFLDGIFLGEGELTVTQVVSLYRRMDDSGERKAKLEKMEGVGICNKDGQIQMNVQTKYMDMDQLPFAYSDLSEFQNKIIYYESSRGCPFSCSYCMSSLDKRVRFKSIDKVKEELSILLDHKVLQVKFVDRTFNCKKEHTMAILQFMKEKDNGITNFHFEISADLLSKEEMELMASLRKGQIQLEIGVQTTNIHTLKEIQRTTDMEKLKEAVRTIRSHKNIHIHLDLIAGLPFEDMKSFQESFCRVYSMEPDQLQLGFLKLLKGSHMKQMAKTYQMEYKSEPPYEILSTKWISYEEILRLKRIEHMVETYYNTDQFANSIRFMEKFFQDPFQMYDYLGKYYEENGSLGVSHSRIQNYRILREAFEFKIQKEPEKDRLVDGFSQILNHDLYLRENMKSRPEFSKDLTKYKEQIHGLFKEEELIRKLLPDYKEYQTKQIERMTHMDYYDLDIEATVLAGKIIPGSYFLLYDYKNRDEIDHRAKVKHLNLANGSNIKIRPDRIKVKKILSLLDEHYTTEYKCYLNHETPWQLLIATILSAQCTDERVNMVTKDLFVKYPDVASFAMADQKELEKDIYQTGFYKNKAKNIIQCMNRLVEVYHSQVPKELDDLLTLAGVGRKTANVIRGNIFDEPSIVVDTHVKRISNKLGFTLEEDPVKIEFDLMEILPKEHWILYNIQIITHGRTICVARNPKCNECFLRELCDGRK